MQVQPRRLLVPAWPLIYDYAKRGTTPHLFRRKLRQKDLLNLNEDS